MWGTRTSYVHTFPKTRYVYKWIRLLDLCRWGPCWLVSFGFLVTCVVGVKEILLFSLSLFGENFSEQRQWSYGMWRNWVFSKHVLLKIRKLCLRSVVFLKISEFLWYRGFAAPSVERTPGKWHVPCSTLFLVQMLIVQHSFWFSGCGRFPVNAGCLGSLCLDGWIVPSEAIQGLDQKLTSAFSQIDPVFVNLKHKLVLILSSQQLCIITDARPCTFPTLCESIGIIYVANNDKKASEVKWAVSGWYSIKKHAGFLRLLRIIALLLQRWVFWGLHCTKLNV